MDLRVDTLAADSGRITGNSEVMWRVPLGDFVYNCVQEGEFEGPENGPKQRRINNRLLSYRPE